jgi:hypothetical protein
MVQKSRKSERWNISRLGTFKLEKKLFWEKKKNDNLVLILEPFQKLPRKSDPKNIYTQ